jgi:hypothetical protein
MTDRVGHLLDGNGRIDAVLIEQVDTVGAKPAQGAFHASRICSGRLFLSAPTCLLPSKRNRFGKHIIS